LEEAQMLTNGTVVIGTGDDNLRKGSRATVRLVARNGVVYEKEVAHGGEFAEWTSATDDLPVNSGAEIADIQSIEVAFRPDHQAYKNDDEWYFESLNLTVDDNVLGTTTLFNGTVHHKFESADTWSSGTLPTYTPVVATSISSGTMVIGTGDDDLRQHSQVRIRFVARGVDIQPFEVADGVRFPDRTLFTTRFAVSDQLGNPVPIADIIRIEVSFVPDRRAGMQDDKWWFESFKVTVDDGSADGVVLFDAPVHYKFERRDTWTTGILPTFQQMNESVVQVTDEAGAGVMGAEVFVDDLPVGETDRLGQLLVTPTVDVGQRVVARLRVHEQDYYRSHHDTDSTKNWNYRVYLTNVTIDPTGIMTATDTRDGPNVWIAVARKNTLIGVNLLATTDWDATDVNLRGLSQTFAGVSAFLYNATDGQFFIDHLKIVDSQRMWDDSDYRILADESLRSYSLGPSGGFLGWNIYPTGIHMARTDYSDIYTHEFGHFGLDLDDEYEDDDPSKQCTAHPPGPFEPGRPQASCIMWSEYKASKLCSTHTLNPHVHGLQQGDTACWDKLVSRYNHKPQWKVVTPVDRGDIPKRIMWDDLTFGVVGFLAPVVSVENMDAANLIGDCALTIMNTDGLAVKDLTVKTRDGSGRWITQGITDENGWILIVGVHDGDRVRIEGANGLAHEENIPAGATTLTIIVT
jgi:hypothetical protein